MKEQANFDARERLIVALDVPSREAALSLVEELGDQVIFYKIGFELFTAAGLDLVREMLRRNRRVFLDLKLYDISETVRKTVAIIAREGVDFLTIHGNDAIIRAAVQARAGSNLRLLAVTVLTSFDAADIQKLGLGCDVAALAVLRARNAVQDGCDGVITSAQEAAAIKAATGGKLLIVTPGIRQDGADVQDQKRVATPAVAIANGADYLVVGRPITGATDRKAAAQEILAEMQAAFAAV